MKIKHFTVKGNRKINEDYILSKEINDNASLHIVADGMGGYNQGDVASKTVTNILFDIISTEINNTDYNSVIEKAISKANSKISELNGKQNTKMGTTIAGVLIVNSNAYMFWVGDVKILQIRNSKLIFESKDHSLINQLKDNESFTEKIDYGKIRHIVTRSIQGTDDKSKPDFNLADLQEEDKIIICSDGILDIESLNNLTKLDIDSLEDFSKQIENGRDNSSLIVIIF